MPHYLCQISYTAEGWAALLRKASEPHRGRAPGD